MSLRFSPLNKAIEKHPRARGRPHRRKKRIRNFVAVDGPVAEPNENAAIFVSELLDMR